MAVRRTSALPGDAADDLVSSARHRPALGDVRTPLGKRHQPGLQQAEVTEVGGDLFRGPPPPGAEPLAEQLLARYGKRCLFRVCRPWVAKVGNGQVTAR